MIPLNVPNLDGHDQEQINSTIKSGWVSSAGPDIANFEEEFASYIGSDFAVACASGTAALHVSLIANEIKFGSDVLVPALSFIATANAISYTGASPVFVDIDSKTLAIDFKKSEDFINKNYIHKDGRFINKITGNVLDAIVPVHLLGSPFNIKELFEFTKKFNLKAVIDSAEALGAEHDQGMVGSDDFINCFSFNGNKIITTGGGGMITTNSDLIASKLKHLTTTAKRDPIFFIHDEVGHNYRLVNLLAALGRSQLLKLNKFLEIKRKIHKTYKEKLDERVVNLFEEPLGVRSNYWLNMITVSDKIISEIGLNEIINYFYNLGIEVRPLWSIITDLKPYINSQKDDLSSSYNVWNNSLCIPSSTTLSKDDLNIVVESVNSIGSLVKAT